jgi:palmitoyl-protein thioesterase
MQGVYGFPRCPTNFTYVCDYVRKLLNLGAYVDFVQDRLVQAQYWHDPLNEKEYIEKSKFIAEINQERVFNFIFTRLTF